jgi:hypothetical protein
VIAAGRGLFCANSSKGRGFWPSCKGYWCDGCYKLDDDGFFPIRKPTDEEGYVLEVEKDVGRFLYGREGDHLVTTFQCDTCHFRNITNRSPKSDGSDDTVLKFVRRANLDALWSRSPGTVRNTAREIRSLHTKAGMLGLDASSMLPPMGPWPIKDAHGMGVAVCILLRSLDPGRNETTIQFSTSQKMKSAFANVWKASLRGSDGAVVSRDTVKLFHTDCPTHGDWFERFTKGMHERMGDKVKQDLAISIDQVHALMHRYETRWVASGQNRDIQKGVLFPALFSIVCFCCALRGEEAPLMSLTGTALHAEEGALHPSLPHVVVALLGRFKMEVSEKYHLMPLVLRTDTGLEPAKWIYRMIQWYEEGGVTRGWVFRNKTGDRAKASDYEWDILCELENIQRESPHIISASVDVFDEFGVSRSFRRGSDTHAINQGVKTEDIERNNRWRTVEQAQGKAAKLRMIHHYSDVRNMLKALLRYSRPL